MSNDYYVRQASLAPRTKAKGDQIIGELDAVSAGFDKLPAPRNDGTGFSEPLRVGDPTDQAHAVPLSLLESTESSIGQDKAEIEQLKNEVNSAKASVDQSEIDINNTAAEVAANKNLSEQSKLDAQQAVLEAQQEVAVAEQHSSDSENFSIAANNSAEAASQSNADAGQKRDDSLAYSQQSEQSAIASQQSADRAENTIAMLPVGAINDVEIGLDKTWSSGKISEKISNNAPFATPIPISPLTGSSGLSIVPELSAAAFRNAFNETRTVRRFQVDLASGDFSTPVYEYSNDLDLHTVSVALTPTEDYKWRCRDETSYENSEWSSAQLFSTSAAYIYPPTGLLVDDSLDFAPTVIVDEAFSVFNGTDTHQSTDLQVWENGSLVYESLDNTTDLYNIKIPKGVLEVSTEYTFKVSFKGNTISNSEYGEVVFTTNDEFDIRDLWAVAPQSAPYLKIFEQDVDSLNLLDSVSDISTHSSPQRNDNIAFSKRGTYVAKVLNSAPFLQTYKRDRAEFTILPEVPGDALGYVNGVVFVGDSIEYMIVGHSTAPYLAVFRIDNGVFTRMPDLNDMPATAVSSLTTNIKGDHFALIAGSNVSVYSVTDDIFSRFAENITHSTIADIAISQDGTYMIVILRSGTHVNVYKKTNGVYSLITSSVSNSDNNGIGEWVLTCALSDDANYLAIGHRYQSSTTDFLTLFKRDQDNFIRLPNPSAVPSHNVWDMVFSDDSGYLGISTHTGGFLYKIDGDTFTKIEASSTALGYGYGIAYCNTGE